MAFLTTLIYLACTVLLAIYIFYKRKFGYWKARRFAHTSPTIPWGDMKGASVSQSVSEIFAKLYKLFPTEKVVGCWIFHSPALLVRDPELVKSIFVRDFMSFHDRGINVDYELEPLMGHLFFLGGNKWRNLRVKLSPTFTSGKMKMMFPILAECSKQFSKVLEEPAKSGEVIEVKDYAARFTTDIIASVAFGLDANSLTNPSSDFRRFGESIFQMSTSRALKALIIDSFPRIASFFSLKRLPEDVEGFFMDTLRQTIKYRNNQNITRNDFLQLLIQLMNQGYVDDVDGESSKKQSANSDTSKFTFDEAAANAFVFFIAGFETSSTTMQFALYELAKHPEIQEKVRQEIKAALCKHNGELSYECVMEMHYLSRVIDETLRFHPPAPLLRRECNKDFTVPDSDLVVPKGTKIMIPVLALHHDPTHYKDPEKFNPDRFLDEEKLKRHPFSYLPFGEGPRICIGMRFGLLQTKVGLITLLNNYEFTVAAETPNPIVYDTKGFILSPVGGMNLRITDCRK